MPTCLARNVFHPAQWSSTRRTAALGQSLAASSRCPHTTANRLAARRTAKLAESGQSASNRSRSERYSSLHPVRLPLRKQRLNAMHGDVSRSGAHPPSTGPVQDRGRIGDPTNYPVDAPHPFISPESQATLVPAQGRVKKTPCFARHRPPLANKRRQLASQRGGPLQLPDQPLEAVTTPRRSRRSRPTWAVSRRLLRRELHKHYATIQWQKANQSYRPKPSGGGPGQIRSEKLENGSLNR